MYASAEDLRELGLTAQQAKDGLTVRKAYLRLSVKRHPDKGGSTAAFQKLSSAYRRVKAYAKQHSAADSKAASAQQQEQPSAARASSTASASAHRQEERRSNNSQNSFSGRSSSTSENEHRNGNENNNNPYGTSTDHNPHQGRGSYNDAYQEDDNDFDFWNDAFFFYFRRTWEQRQQEQQQQQQRQHRRQGEYNYNYSNKSRRDGQQNSTGDSNSGEDEDFFTRWENVTARDRARQRAENVKRGYDFRDRPANALPGQQRSRGRHNKCSFCKKNQAISQNDAKEHGLNWKEYINPKGSTDYGYPRYFTCWACKNSHKSALTQNMALDKYTMNHRPVLDYDRYYPGYNIFATLRRMKRSFHHQPFTDFCNYTRNCEYFWAPDLEQEAIARGWRPRGHKRLATPETNEDRKAAATNTAATTGQLPAICIPRTPKRPKRTIAPVVTPEAQAPKPSTSAHVIPKQLFGSMKSTTSVPKPRTTDEGDDCVKIDYESDDDDDCVKIHSDDEDDDDDLGGDWRAACVMDY